MNVDPAEIERLVRAALDRLGRSEEEKQPTTGAAKNSQTPAPGTLTIEDRVITLSSIAERLAGVRRMAVGPRAVVTPAVRDRLREAGIELVRRSAERSDGSSRQTLMVGVAGGGMDVAGVSRKLEQDGVAVEQVASSGLASVVAELADHVARGGKLAAVFTDRGLAAACLANRVRGVRAAVLVDAAAARRAVTEVGLNLVVIEIDGRGTFAVQQTLREFCRAASRECPADLKQHLT